MAETNTTPLRSNITQLSNSGINTRHYNNLQANQQTVYYNIRIYIYNLMHACTECMHAGGGGGGGGVCVHDLHVHIDVYMYTL